MAAVTPSFAAREQYVEAFESARQAGWPTRFHDFLPPPDHPHYRTVLGELIRVDLEIGWSENQPRALDDYLDEFPELRDDAAILAAIAYEEFRLRRQAGQLPSVADYVQRYGIGAHEWPNAGDKGDDDGAAAVEESPTQCLARAARRYRLAGASELGGDAGGNFLGELYEQDAAAAERLVQGLTSFPSAGDRFLDFKLLRELGRGAFGRVFLAEQDGLAGRHVALKVAADLQVESQTLAQMQHTHIMPIYSVHRADPLHAVCMPYLGSVTLADLLSSLSQRPEAPRTGLELWSISHQRRRGDLPPPPTMVVDTVRNDAAPAMAPVEEDSVVHISRLALAPAIRKRLEGYSYVEAVLWLGECLADGLAHAHDRGILHRDLKPANVLLTDDGQPMLLDFNLAEDTKLRGSASGALVGGTLLYMSPEHLESFQGKRRKQLDERTDIYALGVILFQLLTRQYPFVSGSSSGKNGSGKSSSLPELIEEMKTERRRPPPPLRKLNGAVSPAAEAIVCKCLDPDPDKRYQTARQLQEDLRRQLEGLPLKYATEPSWRERLRKWWRRHPRLLGRAAALGLVAALAVASVLFYRADRLARAEKAWTVFDQFRGEVATAQHCLTAQGDDPNEQERGLVIAHRALQRYGSAADTQWTSHAHVASLPAPQRQQLRREMGELLLLVARAELGAAATPAASERKIEVADARERLQQSLELNRLAENCFDSDAPAALWWQRADLMRRIGNVDEGERLRRQAEQATPRTADDYYLQARELVGENQVKRALPLLRQATRLDPRHYWAWLLQGRCLSDLGEELKAANCYSVCIALQPESARAYFNRGLVHIQLKDYPQAQADFDRAITLQPEFTEAYLNRALVRQSLKNYQGAVDDLTEALQLGGAPTRVYFLRARAREHAGDKDGAQADFNEGLRREPTDERSWLARGLARLAKEPNEALADFDKALALNPRSRAALRNKAHVLAERLNRPADAVAALDQVIEFYPDFATSRAERGVMHARMGQRDLALEDARQALARDRRPALCYQVACIYALTSKQQPADRAEALRLLRDALRLGYGTTLLATDHDLDALRPVAEFQRLREAVATLQPTARR